MARTVERWFHVKVEIKNSFGFWSPFGNVDVAGDGFGNAIATFDAATFDPGRYWVSASSYGSVLVGNGQSSVTRFGALARERGAHRGLTRANPRELRAPVGCLPR